MKTKSMLICPECGNSMSSNYYVSPSLLDKHGNIIECSSSLPNSSQNRRNRRRGKNKIIHLKKIKNMYVFKPKDITTNHWFLDSVFRNSECEMILRNIVLLQKNANPEMWTPFSWEDYKKFCSHDVTYHEKDVLDAFVNGGKPVLGSSAFLESGWLDFDGERYSFTLKMVAMLGDRWATK